MSKCIWTGARLWLSQYGCLCSVDLFEIQVPLENSRNEALYGSGGVWIFDGLEHYQYPQCSEEDEGDIVAATRRLYGEATHRVDEIGKGLSRNGMLIISPIHVEELRSKS